MAFRLKTDQQAAEFAAKHNIDPAELGLTPATIEQAKVAPRAPGFKQQREYIAFDPSRVLTAVVVGIIIIVVLTILASSTVPGNGWR